MPLLQKYNPRSTILTKDGSSCECWSGMEYRWAYTSCSSVETFSCQVAKTSSDFMCKFFFAYSQMSALPTFVCSMKLYKWKTMIVFQRYLKVINKNVFGGGLLNCFQHLFRLFFYVKKNTKLGLNLYLDKKTSESFTRISIHLSMFLPTNQKHHHLLSNFNQDVGKSEDYHLLTIHFFLRKRFPFQKSPIFPF